MAGYDTPDMVAAIGSLAALGLSDSAIATAVGIARGTVLRIRQDHGIEAGRERYGTVPEPPMAPRAELVAAARPWAQRPWSAKEGLQ